MVGDCADSRPAGRGDGGARGVVQTGERVHDLRDTNSHRVTDRGRHGAGRVVAAISVSLETVVEVLNWYGM